MWHQVSGGGPQISILFGLLGNVVSEYLQNAGLGNIDEGAGATDDWVFWKLEWV